jgi:hypothetical protein
MREDERRDYENNVMWAGDRGFSLMSVEPTEPHFKCPMCGAIVEDWRLHEEWHEEIGR